MGLIWLLILLGHLCLSGGWLDADLYDWTLKKASCVENILDYVLKLSEPL